MPALRKNLSLGITAFLDILGCGDRIQNAHKDGDITAIVADIRAIQEQFEFNPKDKQTRKLHAGYKKTVLAFSDCVVVNVALESTMTKLQGTFDPIMSELSGMAFAQARCATGGLFMRGGVDIGWWYRKGTVLASESLVGAYKAEGTASIPVIALTDKLFDFLSSHGDRKFYSKDIEPIRTLLRQHSYKGPKGKVSFWYLDYISVIAESIDWITSEKHYQSCVAAPPERRDHTRELGYRRNLRRWFREHARQIALAHARAKNASVQRKYEWLAAYHNEIAPRFIESPLALCVLTKP